MKRHYWIWLTQKSIEIPDFELGNDTGDIPIQFSGGKIFKK